MDIKPGTPVRLKDNYGPCTNYAPDCAAKPGDLGIYIGVREDDERRRIIDRIGQEKAFHRVFILGLGEIKTAYMEELEVIK